MDAATRRKFDRQLEWVLRRLPPEVKELLEEVPLHVEDHPSPEVMREMGIEHRDELCGWYSGVPLGDRSATHPPPLPDMVFLYREGNLALATDDDGYVDIDALREEIRITILHELGHYHGMDEEELGDLGFD